MKNLLFYLMLVTIDFGVWVFAIVHPVAVTLAGFVSVCILLYYIMCLKEEKERTERHGK